MSEMRNRAAQRVANNWRIRRRLPRITMYAIIHGFIKRDDVKEPVSLPPCDRDGLSNWLS